MLTPPQAQGTRGDQREGTGQLSNYRQPLDNVQPLCYHESAFRKRFHTINQASRTTPSLTDAFPVTLAQLEHFPITSPVIEHGIVDAPRSTLDL